MLSRPSVPLVLPYRRRCESASRRAAVGGERAGIDSFCEYGKCIFATIGRPIAVGAAFITRRVRKSHDDARSCRARIDRLLRENCAAWKFRMTQPVARATTNSPRAFLCYPCDRAVRSLVRV